MPAADGAAGTVWSEAAQAAETGPRVACTKSWEVASPDNAQRAVGRDSKGCVDRPCQGTRIEEHGSRATSATSFIRRPLGRFGLCPGSRVGRPPLHLRGDPCCHETQAPQACVRLLDLGPADPTPGAMASVYTRHGGPTRDRGLTTFDQGRGAYASSARKRILARGNRGRLAHDHEGSAAGRVGWPSSPRLARYGAALVRGTGWTAGKLTVARDSPSSGKIGQCPGPGQAWAAC